MTIDGQHNRYPHEFDKDTESGMRGRQSAGHMAGGRADRIEAY